MIPLEETQLDRIDRMLREVIAEQRARRKPRKRTAVERNRAAYVARAPKTSQVDDERIRRLMLGLKP
jgi:hypothetical protein